MRSIDPEIRERRESMYSHTSTRERRAAEQAPDAGEIAAGIAEAAACITGAT